MIGIVARFGISKDYKTYIKVAENVLSKRSDVTFLSVGGGEYIGFQELIREENKNRFLFLGEQKNVESIMNICDIGVLTTFREGLPNSVLEFMALGKAVIATEVGGLPELIEENISGKLCKIGDEEMLETQIHELLDSPNKMKLLGENAKIRIKKIFNIDIMVKQYVEIYKIYENTK